MIISKEENDNEIVIRVKGRLDTNTCGDLDNEMKSVDNTKNIVFDFQELEYISSAGLRSILNTKKVNESTKVINCNSEVYDTFSMTGFTEIIDVSKAKKNISIRGCEIINKGTNNTLYRLDNEKMVKVYNEGYSLDLIKKEIEFTRKAFVLGVPTIIPYELVKVDDLDGAIYEFVNSKSLQQLIVDGEKIETVVRDMVVLLKKIHSVEPDENELPSYKKKIIEMGTKCKDLLSKENSEKLMSLIYDIPMASTMLHGNFHIKNIMKNNDETIVIDMDTISTGHPIIDLGIIYARYKGISCVDNNKMEQSLGITKEQGEEIIQLIFQYYYNDKTPQQISEIIDKASIIGYIKLLYENSISETQDDITKKEIEFCINYLEDKVPNIDSLIG